MTALIITHAIAILGVIAMFFVRGIGTLFQKDWIKKKVFKIAPHVIDTIMLVSGISLVIMSGYSFSQDWIWAKIIAVIAYIFFALMAFKRATTRKMQSIFWIGGLITLFYIVAVAKTKMVWPF